MQRPPMGIAADILALRSSGLDVLIDTGNIPDVSRTENCFSPHHPNALRGVLMRTFTHQNHTSVGRTMCNSNRSVRDNLKPVPFVLRVLIAKRNLFRDGINCTNIVRVSTVGLTIRSGQPVRAVRLCPTAKGTLRGVGLLANRFGTEMSPPRCRPHRT